MILLVMVMCVNVATTNAQRIISVSSYNITFDGGIKVPVDAVPFGGFLPSNCMLPVAIKRAIEIRRAYWGHDYIGFANEFACEMAKLSALNQLLAGANAASNRSVNYEARKHADAKRASQRYAEKRATEKRTTGADSTHNNDTTGSFATGL